MSLAALLSNCECSVPARVAVPVGRAAVGGDATDAIMRLKLSGRKGPTRSRDCGSFRVEGAWRPRHGSASSTCPVEESPERLSCCGFSNGVFAGAGVRLQMLRAATPSQALGKCCSLVGCLASIGLSACVMLCSNTHTHARALAVEVGPLYNLLLSCPSRQ